MKVVIVLALVAMCLCTARAGNPIRAHVVYAQYFPIEYRSLSKDQALTLMAPTLSDEVRMIAGNRAAHEIIAILLAACSSHTQMPTEVEGYEIPTHIFVFSDEAAARLTDFRIAKPPPAPPPPNNSLAASGTSTLPPRRPPPQQLGQVKPVKRKSAYPPDQPASLARAPLQETPYEEEQEQDQQWFDDVAQQPLYYDE